MLSEIKKINLCLYCTVLLCLIGVFLSSKLHRILTIKEKDRIIKQTNVFSNASLSRQNNLKAQSVVEIYNHTLGKRLDQRRWDIVDPLQTVRTGSSTVLPDISNAAKNNLILYWETPNWFKAWTSSTDMKLCLKYRNCELSYNRSLFNQSQAVVFNIPHRGVEQRPPVTKDARNPNQIWVFFTLESPFKINAIYRNQEWHNVFNWSWTYHPHADIFHPYGALVKRQTPLYKNYTNIFKKKTKFAAWVVSNCHAPSKRNEFVNILKRYIDVDIFGSCGQPAPENLESFLNEKYKFYLSLENSLCDDYMTEKVFHYYELDLITVLRGKAKYKEFLPTDSYVDTENFSSIAELAQFMKVLGNNEENYVSYLKVRDKYKVFDRKVMYKNAVCSLCEKLNDLEKNRKVYKDIFKWLGQCHQATDLNEKSTFHKSAKH